MWATPATCRSLDRQVMLFLPPRPAWTVHDPLLLELYPCCCALPSELLLLPSMTPSYFSAQLWLSAALEGDIGVLSQRLGNNFSSLLLLLLVLEGSSTMLLGSKVTQTIEG